MNQNGLIGRSDDWWDGYRAGCEATHSDRCDAVLAERDDLRVRLERAEVVAEQRIRDLQREFALQRKVLERQLAQVRSVDRGAA